MKTAVAPGPRSRRIVRRPHPNRLFSRTHETPWVAMLDALQAGFQLTQIQLADQVLHCSPRSLALWKSGRTPNAAALIRIKELHRLLKALGQLTPPEHIGPWMKKTNDFLAPLTPLEVISRGELDRLWHIVHNVGTGMPT